MTTAAPLSFAELREDAVELIDQGTRCPILLICEHASNRMPPMWGTLGLSERQLADHIGWDIGAAEITRALALHLGATAVLSRYSRLYIDCNRHPDRDDAIPAVSDGCVIPGNAAITAEERLRRQKIAFQPLHEQIAAMIDRHLADGVQPIIVCIHSFTPTMNGRRRPWAIGVLWNECDALAASLLNLLQSNPENGLMIGANEPYSAKTICTYTLECHGRRRGLENIAIEVRNDLAADDHSRARIIEFLEKVFRQVLP